MQEVLKDAIQWYVNNNRQDVEKAYKQSLDEATAEWDVDQWNEFCLDYFTKAEWLNLYLKHITSCVCSLKKSADFFGDERKKLQEILLNNEKYKELQENEKKVWQEYADWRALLEQIAYLEMKRLKTDKGALFTENGKISFAIKLHANITDNNQVINYLNEKWLHDFTKQILIKKAVEQLVLSQMWVETIPGTEIIETADLKVNV